MRASHRITFAVGAALIVGVLFFTANHLTNRLLTLHATTLQTLAEMGRLEQELDRQLLEDVYQLHANYDSLHHRLAQLRELIQALRVEPHLAGEGYTPVRNGLDRYASLIDEKEHLLLRFATLNSVIKNSIIQIPLLSARYLERFGGEDTAYQREIARITASLFLVSTGFDGERMALLRASEQWLAGQTPLDADKAAFHASLLAHARVFVNNYSPYQGSLEQIAALPTETALDELRGRFVQASADEAERIGLLSVVLAVLFVASIVLVVFILMRLDTEHKALGVLHARLQEAAGIDRLTHIRNRFAFERESARMAAGSLLVINLDRFGPLNDLYGHTVGDMLLKRVAAALASVFTHLPGVHLYRLSGDEFGLFCEAGAGHEPQQLAQQAIDVVERQQLSVQGHSIPLSVSIGYSCEAPLLEKADMALKAVRRARGKVLEYSAELGVEQQVAHNMATLELVRKAIADDRVVPFFQPILNLHTDRIEAYECLVRVIDESGNLLAPDGFLEVVRESRLYGELTRIMLEKSIARFRHNTLGFHLNLSTQDILDPLVHDTLFDCLVANPEIGPRLTLELVESEQPGYSEALEHFVGRVREHGCKVAIDDFGRGYSNLSHLLALAIDNLKLDGSLIRHIDSDSQAQALVEAVTRLVASADIRTTTAEHVHSEAVLAAVRALGVDYAQGYAIGQPQADLPDGG